VIVLDDGDRGAELLGADREDLGDVAPAQHVAVQEERPAAVAGKVRDEEPRQAEGGRGERIRRPPIEPHGPELGLDQGRDGDRSRGARQDRVREDVVGDALALVVADEDPERRAHACGASGGWYSATSCRAFSSLAWTLASFAPMRTSSASSCATRA